MRFHYLLASALFALLSLNITAHEHEHELSLAGHEHGVVRINIALEAQQLEMELQSPAMNIVGFEYQPSSAADQQALVAAEKALKNEHLLFKLTADAHCVLSAVTLNNDLAKHMDETAHTTAADSKHGDAHAHSDIQVNYQFTCSNPNTLKHLDFAGIFRAFPLTEKIHVQWISTDAQDSALLSPSNTTLNW